MLKKNLHILPSIPLQHVILFRCHRAKWKCSEIVQSGPGLGAAKNCEHASGMHWFPHRPARVSLAVASVAAVARNLSNLEWDGSDERL